MIQQASKTLPTIENQNNAKTSNVEQNRPFSKANNAIDKEHIVTINELNPYMNKWTIKVRVTSKSQIRNYQNARGPGVFFTCDLVDQSGEIRAAAFNAECDKFYPLLEIGKV